MPKESKVKIVSEIKEQLESAQSAVFVDYSGLDANKLNELRRILSKHGARLLVAKNTLIHRALPSSKYKGLAALEGPTALISSPKSDLTVIKKLVEFSKEIEKPKIKLGFFDKELLTSEQVKNLAKIPEKEELLTQLGYNLHYPIYSFVIGNKRIINKLALAIQQIANQKEA